MKPVVPFPDDDEEEIQCGFELKALRRVFQMNQHDLYIDGHTMEFHQQIMDLLLQSIFESHACSFKELIDSDPETTEILFCNGEAGDFACHFTYLSQNDSTAEPSRKMLIYIGRFGLNAHQQIDHAFLFFMLHGVIETPDDTNGESIFFPIEAGCRNRTPEHEQESFCFADNEQELVQMLCYGHQAIGNILSGEEMKLADLAKWLDHKQEEAANQRYDEIFTSSEADLRRKMELKKSQQQTDPLWAKLSISPMVH